MSSLVGVLTRFREKPIAIAADIKAMFSQVLVKQDDQNFQVSDGNLDLSPQRYVMIRHIFGATSSPFIAAYALQESALQTQDEHAKLVIKSDFYVDDLLMSCDSTNQATQLSSELISTL